MRRTSSRERWLLAGLLLFPLAACGKGTDDGGARSDAEIQETLLRRERVAHHAGRADWERAATELLPLVEGDDAELRDLISATTIELQTMDLAGARGFLARGREQAPDDPALAYLDARMKTLEADFGGAVEAYQRALASAPDDPASRYGLALAYYDLETEDDAEYEGNLAQAKQLCESILSEGLETRGAWYVAAAYRLYLLSGEIGTPDEQRQYADLWQNLTERGAKAPGNSLLNGGELARVRPPAPLGNTLAESPTAPGYLRASLILPELATARVLRLHDMNSDRRTDIVANPDSGLWIAYGQEDGSYTADRIVEGAVNHFAAVDLDEDDLWDLVVTRAGSVELWLQGEAGWAREILDPPLPSFDAARLGTIVPIDYDHDGDLDLLIGRELLRNDGVGLADRGQESPTRGAFRLATPESGLARDSWRQPWALNEDFDSDQDVDVLVAGGTSPEGPVGPALMSSLRAGRFEDQSERAFGAEVYGQRPLPLDADGDGRVDLLMVVDGELLILRQDAEQAFVPVPTGIANVPDDAQLLEVDLDLDGFVDVFWAEQGHLARGVLAVGLDARSEVSLGELEGPVAPIAFDELDSTRGTDLRQELVRATPQGIEIWRTDSEVGGGIRLNFVGKKDNRQGIGAIVEVRARDRYRRIFWRGDAQLVGTGPHDFADVVRVTWPNGVATDSLDVELGNQHFLDDEDFGVQEEGLIGSCPFLYTWNGETYEFISDVIGITPLGLPMAPVGLDEQGRPVAVENLVPPDHDEYVLVRGEQLVPRDGKLELQFTEELREVTYLDRVRLDVIDHPVGSEIYPNERFTFPPFPEPHVHSIEEPLAPTRAVDPSGHDWSVELAAIDDMHAMGFTPLKGQFLGLATPHWLELEFDAERLAGATKLRLVCTGWLYWTDASVNVATARTPELAFIPPILQLPEAPGSDEWVDAGPPVGFPAGKTKTMVLDVSELLSAEDPRIRIFSSLALYWDSIRLAVDDDDAQRVLTELEPDSARLWRRGFSAPVETERDDLPERFDWNVVAQRPRWNQHPGMYTRLGETLPLLTAIDDQYVIMGSGECLTLTFDAAHLPPLREGWRRDYLVFLDGWAKDRDPNTIGALEVEPLPFHGMSRYPYPAQEHFPDGPEHAAWRAAWNTRPAYRPIVPLAPVQESEWVAEWLHAAPSGPRPVQASAPIEPGESSETQSTIPEGTR